MKTVSVKELQQLKSMGHEIYDIDGKKVDADYILIVSQIEELKKYTEELGFLKKTHEMMIQLPKLLTNMMTELQRLNKSVLSEAKKTKPQEIRVEPNINIPEIKVPEITAKVENEPPAMRHEVTEMTQTGRPIVIISTPIEKGVK